MVFFFPEAMISLLLYIMQKNLKNAENAAYSGTKWNLFCCPWCWNRSKPVTWICRGLQLINAALGGSLYQDLPTEHPSSICHRQPAPYDQPIHQVELVPDTPLQKCLEKDELPVNSCHHQGIKELASTLQPMAYAQDGLLEAVWKPGSRFVWAVQWHPEFFP